MDRYELVLDIVEHPEKYSPERLNELLSEPETKEIYNLVCRLRSSMSDRKSVNVDEEWLNFMSQHSRRKIKFMWLSGRAASIAILLMSSIVAIAIGFSVKIAVFDSRSESEVTSDKVVESTTVTASTDTPADTAITITSPILFEDATLLEVMESVGKVYNVALRFNNRQTENLHLYYRLNPELTLEETIEQLNTFEQINIHIADKTLIID